MLIIVLGLLVVAGLLAYMYFTGNSEGFIRKKPQETEPPDEKDDDDASTVIYLPNDLEKEKKKRKVKTGK